MNRSVLSFGEKLTYVSDCQLEMDRLGCDRFQGDPDIRDCTNEAGVLSKASAFASGQLRCAYSSATGLFSFDGDQSYYNQKFEFERSRFLDECQRSSDCVGKLFEAAYQRPASHDEINTYANSWRIIRRMDYLWSLASLKQNGGQGSWFQNQVEQISQKSGWKNVATEKQPNWKDIKEAINTEYDRYWCLNDTARAEMACFIASALVGGTQALAQLRKLPRYLKLAKLSENNRKRGTLTATNAMREALESKKSSTRRFSDRAPELARSWSDDRIRHWESEIPPELRRQMTDAERAEIEKRYLEDFEAPYSTFQKKDFYYHDQEILRKMIDPEKLRDYINQKIDRLYGENPKPYDKKRIAEIRADFWANFEDGLKNEEGYEDGLIRLMYDDQGKLWSEIDKTIDDRINRQWDWVSQDRETRRIETKIEIAQRRESSHYSPEELRKMEQRAEARFRAEKAERMSVKKLLKLKAEEATQPTSAISSTVEVAYAESCPNCPRSINFVRDDHYDSHTWERIGSSDDFAAREMNRHKSGTQVGNGRQWTRKNDPVVLQYDIQSYLNSTSSPAIREEARATIESRLRGLQHFAAREKKETSVWRQATRDEIIRNFKNIPIKIDPAEKGRSTAAFFGEYRGTKFKAVICIKAPCGNKSLKVGDVTTIYPICGPTIFKIPKAIRIAEALQALQTGGAADPAPFNGLLEVDKCP